MLSRAQLWICGLEKFFSYIFLLGFSIHFFNYNIKNWGWTPTVAAPCCMLSGLASSSETTDLLGWPPTAEMPRCGHSNHLTTVVEVFIPLTIPHFWPPDSLDYRSALTTNTPGGTVEKEVKYFYSVLRYLFQFLLPHYHGLNQPHCPVSTYKTRAEITHHIFFKAHLLPTKGLVFFFIEYSQCRPSDHTIGRPRPRDSNTGTGDLVAGKLTH